MLDDTANKVVATALAQGAIANIHKAVRSKQRAQITVGGEGSDRKTDALKRRVDRTAEMLNRHVGRHLGQRFATGNPYIHPPAGPASSRASYDSAESRDRA